MSTLGHQYDNSLVSNAFGFLRLPSGAKLRNFPGFAWTLSQAGWAADFYNACNKAGLKNQEIPVPC